VFNKKTMLSWHGKFKAFASPEGALGKNLLNLTREFRLSSVADIVSFSSHAEENPAYIRVQNISHP
jgi:hypothetical protein